MCGSPCLRCSASETRYTRGAGDARYRRSRRSSHGFVVAAAGARALGPVQCGRAFDPSRLRI
jgi:hypothetical protein